MEKYGYITNLMCDDTKNKIKDTNLKNYGFENPSQSELIKEKKRKTSFKNYGVDSPLQNDDVFRRQQITAFKMKEFEGIFYRGTYELDFLKKYKNKIDIKNCKSIDYEIDNKIKRYHPDFYIPKHNLIVEIKSDYVYNCDIDKNLSKKQSCLDKGYNFIFIINKDYNDFEKTYN